MRVTKDFLYLFFVVYLATSRLGCQAHPKYGRETLTEDVTESSSPTKVEVQNVKESSSNDPKDAFEDQGHLQKGASKAEEEKDIKDQVFERPTRHSPRFDDHLNDRDGIDSTSLSGRTLLGSPKSSKNNVASIGRVEIHQNSNLKTSIGNHIANIVGDVNTLIHIIERVFTSLQQEITKGEKGCLDCAVLLDSTHTNYKEARLALCGFLKRGEEIVRALIKDPEHLADIAENVASTSNPSTHLQQIAPVLQNLKKKLLRVQDQARKCIGQSIQSRDDLGTLNAFKDYITLLEPNKFTLLDNTESSHYPMQERSNSFNTFGTSRRIFNMHTAQKRTNHREVPEQIEVFDSLLDFLRNVPDIIEDLVLFIKRGCITDLSIEKLVEQPTGSPASYKWGDGRSGQPLAASAHSSRDSSTVDPDSFDPVLGSRSRPGNSRISMNRNGIEDSRKYSKYSKHGVSSAHNDFSKPLFPRCHYMEALHYDGPLDSYGNPVYDQYDEYLNSDLTNDFGDFRGNQMSFRPIGKAGMNLPENLSKYTIQIPFNRIISELEHKPVELGDSVMVTIGRCILVGTLHDNLQSSVELTLIKSFPDYTHSYDQIWDIPKEQLSDVFSPVTMRRISQSCDKLFGPTSRRYRYIRTTAKYEQDYNL